MSICAHFLFCSAPLKFHGHDSSDWDRIKSPAEDQIVPYDTLVAPQDHSNLNKLAVLKVNGGLGTSMGRLLLYLLTFVLTPSQA